MQYIFHSNESRGHADLGWLHSRHTFSFGEYYNPERVNFGALRVLNDDVVEGGRGFGTHPHANMEIVSIPLHGALEHRDSTGHHQTIRTGEVQIMSAGRGIQHSEYNHSQDESVNFLQIWILPDKKDIDSRYEQKEFAIEAKEDSLLNIVAPDNPQALWINQQAWFYLGNFENKTCSYRLGNPENGVYLFVIEGEIQVENHFLKKRDAIGIWEVEEISIKPIQKSRYLLMEVKM